MPVNYLEYLFPGFISHIKVNLIKNRYHIATLFVDNFIPLRYVHHKSNITSDNTLKSKKTFEAFIRKQGVIIGH